MTLFIHDYDIRKQNGHNVEFTLYHIPILGKSDSSLLVFFRKRVSLVFTWPKMPVAPPSFGRRRRPKNGCKLEKAVWRLTHKREMYLKCSIIIYFPVSKKPQWVHLLEIISVFESYFLFIDFINQHHHLLSCLKKVCTLTRDHYILSPFYHLNIIS